MAQACWRCGEEIARGEARRRNMPAPVVGLLGGRLGGAVYRERVTLCPECATIHDRQQEDQRRTAVVLLAPAVFVALFCVAGLVLWFLKAVAVKYWL